MGRRARAYGVGMRLESQRWVRYRRCSGSFSLRWFAGWYTRLFGETVDRGLEETIGLDSLEEAVEVEGTTIHRHHMIITHHLSLRGHRHRRERRERLLHRLRKDGGRDFGLVQ